MPIFLFSDLHPFLIGLASGPRTSSVGQQEIPRVFHHSAAESFTTGCAIPYLKVHAYQICHGFHTKGTRANPETLHFKNIQNAGTEYWEYLFLSDTRHFSH